jgi:predicted protein tyrosine phosphatase
MERNIKDKECKFKITDFNIDLLDHVDADGKAVYKDQLVIDMTLVTNIPIHTVLSLRENVENHMRDMFVSLVNDKKLKNLLFVCEGNAQRSPTFEIWFKEHKPEYEVKSTGTAYGYPERLSEELLEWADRVFLMDLEQEMFMRRKFPEFIFKCEIIGCSDQYPRESAQLYRLIEHWVRKRGL